jgi:tricorn protease-like protein
VGTNFGFRVYSTDGNFELTILSEDQDFILCSGVRIAVPYFSTNVFGLVSLLDSNEIRTSNVLIYDQEEKKTTKTFNLTSDQNIADIFFLTRKILLCGYDSIEIFDLSNSQLLTYLKTGGDIADSLAYCIQTEEPKIAFRHANKKDVALYNIDRGLETKIETKFDEIQCVKFSSSGLKLAIVSKYGDYVEVRETYSGILKH